MTCFTRHTSLGRYSLFFEGMFLHVFKLWFLMRNGKWSQFHLKNIYIYMYISSTSCRSGLVTCDHPKWMVISHISSDITRTMVNKVRRVCYFATGNYTPTHLCREICFSLQATSSATVGPVRKVRRSKGKVETTILLHVQTNGNITYTVL